MTDFVTSDPHLFHPLLATMRGYATPDEFNEAWADAYNDAVRSRKDRVFILGDLTGGSLPATQRAINLLARLRGERHLILGNHDPAHPMYRSSHTHFPMYFPTFASVQLHARKSIGGTRVLLSHMPYQGGGDHTAEDRFNQWRLPDLGTPLIHGHTHSSQLLSKTPNGTIQVNVAWEATHARFMAFEDLQWAVRSY